MSLWILWVKRKRVHLFSTSNTKIYGKNKWPSFGQNRHTNRSYSSKISKLETEEEAENSSKIKERVNKARRIQQGRYKENGIYSNAELTPKLVNKYCKLDKEAKAIMQNAFEKLGLSARAHGRILKVARTIADLDEEENINVNHIAEAIQYRSLDKKYWNN